MGSLQGRYGNQGGAAIFTFAAAGDDSGPIGYGPNRDPAAKGGFGIGWKDFLFMATGNGTGLQIRLYGTIDIPTALGKSAANGGIGEWFELPAPSTEGTTAQWHNPVINGSPTTNAHYVKAPLLAIRGVAEQILSEPITGTVDLQIFVTS